jgi:hypothetical protein
MDANLSSDYEVVTLRITTNDGHRLVTLRLRTIPEVTGIGRDDCTFVFDADDLFVVRSERAESYEFQFDYDHEGGRPIFRAQTGRFTGLDPSRPKGSTRLEVTQRRFGPIPESEFAPESFLDRLKAGGIIRQPVEEPLTATPVDHYWLAFVGGGISLVGGSALALRSRHRDRRAPRAE